MKNTFEKLSDSKFSMSEHDMKQIKGGKLTCKEYKTKDCACIDCDAKEDPDVV